MEKHADTPMFVRTVRAAGFARVNRSFQQYTGWSGAELSQKPLLDWFDGEDRGVLEELIASGCGKATLKHRSRDGEGFEMLVEVRGQGEDAHAFGRCVAGAAADASSAPGGKLASVKATLHRIATIVEEQNPGHKCSILLEEHGRFVKGAGPSLPEDYNNAVDGFAIGPTVGACGTAIYWNVPVIVEDIQSDPLWAPLAELASKAGVAACWSHPFVGTGGDVLGALALYSTEPCAPTTEQLSRLRAAAQMTGLAVERGRAEEQLIVASAVKDRFMANMSHEIRTPLNALMGLTEALDEDSGVTAEEITLMRRSSEQLLELFTGALDLTEAQGRRRTGEEAVDLHDLLGNVATCFGADAAAGGLGFTSTRDGAVPRWVKVDHWALQRTIGILASNAVKFTSSGTVELWAGVREGELEIRVSDTGCGIELDRLAELRQPFVQGDLSTTKEYGGFGLGLALADRCVEALGGQIEFSVRESGGTTVAVRMPLVEAADPHDAIAAPLPSGDPAKPVLVVEDNPLNQAVIGRMLARAGFEHEFADNGAEAVDAMANGDYACVLMDCQMPVMDGYEATRRIRERESARSRHTPIIAVTANALPDDREKCLEAGMDEYLKKPVRAKELAGALESYIGERG